MSLRLYLDDCAFDKLLRDLLRAAPASHHVVTPFEAQMLGASDDVHFAYARDNNLILITKDPDDFVAIHEANPDHPGILVIYHDNLPSDMKPSDIVRAIKNLESANIPFAGHVYNLNDWQY